MKSSRMRCAGHVARTGKMYTKFCSEYVREEEFERPRLRWKDIRMNLRERGELWTGFIWLRVGTSGGLL